MALSPTFLCWTLCPAICIFTSQALRSNLMKIIVTIGISLLASISLLGQQLPSDQMLLSATANEQWLAKLKAQETFVQWEMIVRRYFQPTSGVTMDKRSVNSVPLLVIDGIVLGITENTPTKSRTQLRTLLTHDKIDSVYIIDKEPEGMYVNKAFTGILLVTTSISEVSKELSKIKF